jgi:rhamnose transport system ATP-binding protein
MLELRGVGKHFGGVHALRDVTVTIARGTVHALVGENGAGKSTLGRVAAGVLRPDAGELHLDGAPVRWRSPREARSAGVAMVHQELAVCPDLSVAENVALGAWPTRGPFVDRAAMARRAEELLGGIGARLDVQAPLRALSVAQVQLVQIAAAVGTGARLLVLDEPTSALSEAEAARLMELIEALRTRGTTIVYVSHRLPEVLRLADRITVLRDGRVIACQPREAASCDELVCQMVGREPCAVPAAGCAPGNALLEVEGLASPGLFRDIAFRVCAGEIVGLAGLVGAGRSEIARALFGLDPRATGRVLVAGRPLPLRRPRAALAAGLALLPEDRQRQGLITSWDARSNWSLPRLGVFARGGLVARGREARAAREALEAADVRGDQAAPVASLSGGNQQKVALAKWLSVGARLLIADEPTRGVDVGAKAAIHARLRAVADGGAGVLLISSELPELLALADRVLVLREGRLVSERRRGVGEADLLRDMAGVAS